MAARDVSGAKIREARESKGWSQSQLAWEVRKVNPGLRPDGSAISNYESDKHRPRSAMLYALARALGHPIEFFLEAGGDDDVEEEAALQAALPHVTNVSLSRAMHDRLQELRRARQFA